MISVPITRGMTTLIDADDLEWVSRFSWYACQPNGTGRWYAAANRSRVNSVGPYVIYLHRAVLRLDRSSITGDHINGDSLDNRRANLRPCTLRENNLNKSKRPGLFSSRFKGVTWAACDRRWRAQIGVHGRRVYLGNFSDEHAAALAYDAAAKEHYGEFASVNFA